MGEVNWLVGMKDLDPKDAMSFRQHDVAHGEEKVSF
jgi:hypothetical protein